MKGPHILSSTCLLLLHYIILYNVGTYQIHIIVDTLLGHEGRWVHVYAFESGASVSIYTFLLDI